MAVLAGKMYVFVVAALLLAGVCTATIEFEDGGEHFEPMVAMLCPKPGEKEGGGRVGRKVW